MTHKVSTKKSIAFLLTVKLSSWTEEINFVKFATTASQLTDGFLSSYLALRLASRFTGSRLFEELT